TCVKAWQRGLSGHVSRIRCQFGPGVAPWTEGRPTFWGRGRGVVTRCPRRCPLTFANSSNVRNAREVPLALSISMCRGGTFRPVSGPVEGCLLEGPFGLGDGKSYTRVKYLCINARHCSM